MFSGLLVIQQVASCRARSTRIRPARRPGPRKAPAARTATSARQHGEHIGDGVVLQANKIVDVAGDGACVHLLMGLGIDQAAGDAHLVGGALQRHRQHPVSAERLPRGFGGLYSLRTQLTGRDQLQSVSIGALRDAGADGLGDAPHQRILRRILAAGFDGQHRQHAETTAAGGWRPSFS